MSRGALWVAATAIASCAPKGGGGGAVVHPMVTEKAGGVPLRVVNHTRQVITQLQLAGFAPGNSKQETVPVNIQAGATYELRIDPAALENNELHMTIMKGPTGKQAYQMTVMVSDKMAYHLDGPTQVDVVEDEAASPAVAPGYTQDVRVTDDKVAERAAREAQAAAQHEAAVCQKTLDAAAGSPAPGKTKAQGKFKCVFGGAFDGSMNIQMVQLAAGKITATLTEFGGGTVANNTWTGIVVGDEVRFAWQGLPSGGSAKIDPGGRALLGTGVTLQDDHCVSWTLTCTR